MTQPPPTPQQVCQGNPCWCGMHVDVQPPKGVDKWTQEGHDKFMSPLQTAKRHAQRKVSR